MPDWTNQGGPGAGQDPKAGRRIVACLVIGALIAFVLIKLGVIR